jgi:hypothetical protein
MVRQFGSIECTETPSRWGDDKLSRGLSRTALERVLTPLP